MWNIKKHNRKKLMPKSIRNEEQENCRKLTKGKE